MSLEFDNYLEILESCEQLTLVTTEVCDKFDERAQKAGAFLDNFAQDFGYGLTKGLCMQEKKEAAVIAAGITELTNGLFSAAGELISGLHRKHKIKKAKKIIITKAEETRKTVKAIIPDALECFKLGVKNNISFCKQIRKHFFLDDFDKTDDKKREKKADLLRKIVGEMFTYRYAVILCKKVLKYLDEYSNYLDSDEDLDIFILWYDERISINKREIYQQSYLDVQDALIDGLSGEDEKKIYSIQDDMDGLVPICLTNPNSIINEELNKDVAKKCDDEENTEHNFPEFYYNNDNYKATLDFFSTIFKEKGDDYTDKRFFPILLTPIIAIPIIQIVVFLIAKLGFNIWITLLSLLVGGITGFILLISFYRRVNSKPVNYCFKTEAFLYIFEDFMSAIVDNERDVISTRIKNKIFKELSNTGKPSSTKNATKKDDVKSEEKEIKKDDLEQDEEDSLSDDDILSKIAETGSL